jgi:hypothetical protein
LKDLASILIKLPPIFRMRLNAMTEIALLTPSRVRYKKISGGNNAAVETRKWHRVLKHNPEI